MERIRGRISTRTLLCCVFPVALATVLASCSTNSTSSTTTSTSSTTSTTTSTTAAPSTSTSSTQAAVPPPTAAGGTIAAGSVTCTKVTGKVTFDPPLTGSGTSPEKSEVTLDASGCTVTGSSVKVESGVAVTTIPSPTSACTSLLSSKPVAVAVTWTPSTIHASVLSFSGFSAGTNPAGDAGFVLPSSGGTSVVTGSFAGSDKGAKSTASLYSGYTTVGLLGLCSAKAGLASLNVSTGQVTLS